MKYLILCLASSFLCAQELDFNARISAGDWCSLLNAKSSFDQLTQEQKLTYLKQAQAAVITAHGNFDGRKLDSTDFIDTLSSFIMAGSWVGLIIDLSLVGLKDTNKIKAAGLCVGAAFFTAGILIGLYLKLNPSIGAKTLGNALIVRELITQWSTPERNL